MEFVFAMATCVAIFGATLFWAKWSGIDGALAFPDLRKGLPLILAYVIVLFLQPYLAGYFPVPEDEETTRIFNAWGAIRAGLLIVLVMPVVEEYLFRWVMLKAMQRRLGFWLAAIASSAVWALAHFQYDYFWMAFLVVDGVFLCGITARTKSIHPALALHVFNNFLAVSDYI